LLRPLVIGPGDVPAITDPEEARRSLPLAFMSGIVHSLDMVAVRIGLALAHAIDASPDDGLALYWDAFLASLDEPVRKELEMQLQQHHWEPRSDWGKDFLRERVMGCTDLALLDHWLCRAATGHSLEEALAP